MNCRGEQNFIVGQNLPIGLPKGNHDAIFAHNQFFSDHLAWRMQMLTDQFDP